MDGTYTWTVTATDAAGNQTSTTVTFEIDTVPPPLTVDTPDGITNNPQPPITGTTEPGLLVTIQTGNGPIEVQADGNGDFSITPAAPLTDGLYEWSATVTDAAGNQTSVDFSFEVDTVPPMLQIRQPGDGDVLTQSPDEINGDAEALIQITITLNGALLGVTTADGNGDWAFELDDDLEDGTYVVVVQGTDAAGNTSEDQVTFIVDSTADLVILQPQQGATVRTGEPTIAGNAEPGVEVEIYVDDVLVDTVVADESGQWSWSPDMPLEDGDVEVTVRADSPSGEREASVGFVIDTSTVQVAIDSPQDDALLNDSQPTVSGSAAPGAIVTIFVNGEEAGQVTADENGNWSWSPDNDLDEGENSILVVADDNGIETQATIDISIDTIPPILVVTAPEDEATIGPDELFVRGTSEPGAIIEITVNGEVVGSAVADENGDFEIALPADLEDQEHALRVTATDEAGNVTVVERTFIFETPDDEEEEEEEQEESLDLLISGGGCATSSPEKGNLLLLLTLCLGLAALRRRKR